MVYSSSIEIGRGVYWVVQALSSGIEAVGERGWWWRRRSGSRTELWPGWRRSVTRFLAVVYGADLSGDVSNRYSPTMRERQCESGTSW